MPILFWDNGIIDHMAIPFCLREFPSQEPGSKAVRV
jgi:hypothetical protein